jgi:dihydropteroate synthase
MFRRWRCAGRDIPLGRKTLLMGILNVTPDSFSDGGRYEDPGRAIERAWQMAEEGADLLDVGGMSSRPGSEEIPPEEELRRVEPVLKRLGDRYPLPVSIDTYRASIARAAIDRGACIVNDISALRSDPEMIPLAAESGAGLVLMHMRGTPRTMQHNVEYADIMGEIGSFLIGQSQSAREKGVEPDRIVFDPGIGFGKSVEGNLQLIREVRRFASGAAGVLIGPSRKSFIGKVLVRPRAEERLWGTAAAVALAIEAGADIVRVHDVAPMADVCKVADAIVRGTENHAA